MPGNSMFPGICLVAGAVCGEDVTGIFGEAALQAEVDRTAEMTGREIVRLAAVEQHRAVVAERDHVVDAHRLGVLCPR